MAYIETWANQEMTKPVKVNYLGGTMFSQDVQGNLIGVRLTKNGEAYADGGTVSGNVIRADGGTVAITGSISGNKAQIILPAAAYAVVGAVTIIIKLTQNGQTATIGAFVGMVYASSTDTVVDPGTIIPSIADLIAQIQAAVGSIPADYSALNQEVNDLKSALMQYMESEDISYLADEVGTYIKNDGTIGTSGAYRLSDYVEIPDNASSIKFGNYFKLNDTVYHVGTGCVFYDENKNMISTARDTTNNYGEATIPDGTKYIRFNQINENNTNVNSAINGFWIIIDVAKALIDRYEVLTIAETPSLDGDTVDFHNLEPNKIYHRTEGFHNPTNAPYDNWRGVCFTLRSTSADTAQFVVAISSTNRVHVCHSWGNVPGTYSDWVEIINRDVFGDVLKQEEGFVGTFTASFPYDSKVFRNTGITMLPDTTYRIKFVEKPKTVRIYVHGEGNSDNFRYLQPWENELTFTNDSTARNIRLYNVDGIDPGMLAESCTIEVYKADSVLAKTDDVPRRYTVAKNARKADFTSVTECFLALKDDHRPKIVDIYEGDYDIYSEYVAANVPVFPTSMKRSEPYIEDGAVKYHDVDITPQMDFPEYCVFVPENTHVIGHGVVRLIWSPDPNSDPITWMQCNAVSPVNVMGSMTLENVEIVCKNGRYCIHNDTIGLAPYAETTLRFINVKCYKYPNDNDTSTTPGESHAFGYNHTIGYGMGLSMHHEYENCDFFNSASGRAFYGHTNQRYNGELITESQSGEIILKNCIMDTNGAECVKLGNSGSVQRDVRVKFADCYFSGQINVNNESGSTPVANAYDITFLNCGDVLLHYQDTNNPYNPKGYRTNITIN